MSSHTMVKTFSVSILMPAYTMVQTFFTENENGIIYYCADNFSQGMQMSSHSMVKTFSVNMLMPSYTMVQTFFTENENGIIY